MTWQKSVARALSDLRSEQVRLEKELAAVKQRVAALSGAAGMSTPKAKGKRRQMSAAARAAISRAAKKRWAKYRAEKAGN